MRKDGAPLKATLGSITVKGLSFDGTKAPLLLAALILLLAGLASATTTPEALSPTDRDKLLRVAVELKEAILHEDVEGILRHVSKSNGLICTDTRIPYQQIRKDLHNKNSHLYMSLFDSASFSKKCGSEYPAEYPAISDKEFFTTATSESIEIEPMGGGSAQVAFKSKTKGRYPREFLFHKEGREWKLTDGFVLSRCSCG